MIPADQDLLNAHAAGDTARLCVLYHQAALASDDIDAACFYATHAYVFALECDHPSFRNSCIFGQTRARRIAALAKA